MTDQIAEQAAKIRRLEQQPPAKSPAPAPHGVGASSKRSGRASSKANRKAETNHSSGTSNVTPTWRDVKLGPPEKLLAHPDKLRKALFDNAKRFMSLAEAQRDYGLANANKCFFADSPLAANEPHCPYGTKGRSTCKRDPAGH